MSTVQPSVQAFSFGWMKISGLICLQRQQTWPPSSFLYTFALFAYPYLVFPLVAGVYHCTDPVPAEPDWGIALRVSKEADGVSGDGDDATSVAKRKREGEQDTLPAAAVATADAVVAEQEVSTPPLLVPLQSGDAYFLLDDFK